MTIVFFFRCSITWYGYGILGLMILEKHRLPQMASFNLAVRQHMDKRGKTVDFDFFFLGGGGGGGIIKEIAFGFNGYQYN